MTQETLVFGPFRLDLRNEQLWRGETTLPLKAKTFAVLRYLVAHAGELATKDAIFAAVWPETAVSDSVLTVAIRQLRQALGDRARQPQYIETAHGRGYRFIAPVVEAPPSATPLSPPSAWRQPDVFVGRARELDIVQTWFETAQSGSRRVGFIAGEPGIGKTSLIHAAVARIIDSGAAWVGSGQCIQHYGAGEPYLPILDALGRLSRDPACRQLGDILRRHAPSWLAHLPALLSPEEQTLYARRPPTATAARMIRELAEALEALTAEQPLILVLEDLHWSDTATLEWLSYMARRHDPARLLILGAYRPAEIIVRAHPLRPLLAELRTHANGAELVLDYLSEAAISAYLQQRFNTDQWPRDLPHLLHQRTTGNPLFLTAVVDELARRQILVETASGWGVSGEVNAVAGVAPASLQHLIHQHVESLASGDQAILEAASVVGPRFSVAAVAAVVPLSEAEIEARCTLWTRQDQFLLADGAETWRDGAVAACYRFRHALYHDVVYDRVSAGQRIRLHRDIGDALERRYGEQAATMAAELAVHFERGGADQRAVVYLLQAADNAKRRSAYAEAVAHLSLGLDIAARLPDAPERRRRELAMQCALGAALVALKGYAAPEVADAYGRARQLCNELSHAPERFSAIYGLYAYHIVRGELRTARDLAMQLFDVAQDQVAPAFAPIAPFGLGALLTHAGEPRRGLAYLDQASAVYAPQQHGAQVTQHGVDCGVFAHAYAAHTLWLLGYPDQALARGQAALSLAQQLAHPFSIVLSLAYLAMLEQFRGAPQAVSNHAAAAIALAAEHGFNYYLAWGRFLQAWAQLDANAADTAPMRDSLAALEATGAGLRQPYYLALMAQADGHAGQIDDALSLLAATLEETQRTGEHWWDAELHRLQGMLLLQRDPADALEAEALLRQALDLAQQQQAKSLACRAALSLSQLWRWQGKRDEARACLAPIYHSFTEGFDTADLREARACLGALV